MANPMKPVARQPEPVALKKSASGTPSTPPDVPLELRDQQAAVAATLARNALVADRNFFLMRQIYVQYAMIGFLVLMVTALGLRKPVDHFFVENTAGQIAPVVGLDQPVSSLSFVETWTTNALVQANTYDFSDYRTAIGASQQYFTHDGWNSWVTAIEQSGNLDAVKQNKMVASAIPVGAPVVDSSGLVKGVMTWKFEIPVELDYQVLNQKEPKQVLFLVTVVRVPVEDNPTGLGIQSISFASLSGGV
jgi:intracellular multiplication protein IcmL